MTIREGTIDYLVTDEWKNVRLRKTLSRNGKGYSLNTECLNPTNGKWISHGPYCRFNDDGDTVLTGNWYHGEPSGNNSTVPMLGAPLVNPEDVEAALIWQAKQRVEKH